MKQNLSDLIPLIDGDILVYSCGFAADSQVMKQLKEEHPGMGDEWYKQRQEEMDYVSYALANVRTVINDIQGVFSEHCRIFLTGSGNFREQLATLRPYKGNRDETHKPKYYRDIKDYLTGYWKAEVIHGREADDALGCAQWNADRDTTVIVSIDKDLDNIPGHHYNWRKKEYYYVDGDTADRLFWTQVLQGDSTDNIPGIPKVGEKTAKSIINSTDGTWLGMAEAVLDRYIRHYGEIDGYHNFYENASLLWIQREEDKNFDDNPYRYRHNETLTEEYNDTQQLCDCEEGDGSTD